MTERESADMVAANPQWEEAHLCVVAKERGRWILVVGEMQSDGVFRHADVLVDDLNRCVAPALTALRGASPEGRVALEDRVEAEREKLRRRVAERGAEAVMEEIYLTAGRRAGMIP